MTKITRPKRPYLTTSVMINTSTYWKHKTTGAILHLMRSRRPFDILHHLVGHFEYLMIAAAIVNPVWSLRPAILSCDLGSHLTYRVISVAILNIVRLRQSRTKIYLTCRHRASGHVKSQHQHGLLTVYVKLRMRMYRACRERLPRHRRKRKPLLWRASRNARDRYLTRSALASYQIAATHVPWCVPGSLTHSGGESVPGIPGACATSNFTYLMRGSILVTITKQSHRNSCKHTRICLVTQTNLIKYL